MLLDAPQTTGFDKVGIDPRQLENTYVLNEKEIDPSYIMGAKPGVRKFSGSPCTVLIVCSHMLLNILGVFMQD